MEDSARACIAACFDFPSITSYVEHSSPNSSPIFMTMTAPHKSLSAARRTEADETALRALYEAILLPRLIEEKMLLLIRQGKLSKWFSGIGQEAIAVGVTQAVRETDYILPLHRNLGFFTSRSVPLQRLFCQWQGKQSGFTKGRDRSFHFGAPEYRIIGMISHLGAMLGVADGIALASNIDGNNILEVFHTTRQIAEQVRRKRKPVLLEAITFRMRGHEEASGVKYVPGYVLEDWKKRDPVDTFEQKLLKTGVLTEETAERTRRLLKEQIDTAWDAALAEPDVSSSESVELGDVYDRAAYNHVGANHAKTTTKRFV